MINPSRFVPGKSRESVKIAYYVLIKLKLAYTDGLYSYCKLLVYTDGLYSYCKL